MTPPTIAMKLKPWTVPNFARIEMPARPREEGVNELPGIAIADIPAEALTAMAEQWLTELYSKAGKTPNWSFLKAEGRQP